MYVTMFSLQGKKTHPLTHGLKEPDLQCIMKNMPHLQGPYLNTKNSWDQEYNYTSNLNFCYVNSVKMNPDQEKGIH